QDAAAWLAEWLPRPCGEPALELGAGTGFFTRHALRSARQLVATDASPRMVGLGRAALPLAEWTVAGAENPPAAKFPYRAILTSSLVQWLTDPAAAFLKWHEISAPDALLLGGWFVRGTMEEFVSACPESAPFHWRSAKEWLVLLNEAGWKVRRSEKKIFRLTHKSSAAMLREIHDVGAVAPRRLGAGRLRAALRRNDAKSRAQAGVVTPFVFLRVEAVRA
ncbi:MAG: class I SAM-dependent methyltransferase, partial [Chthoniobacterales bacterium]